MFQVGTRWHPGRHPPILVAGSMREGNGPIGTRWHPGRHPPILVAGSMRKGNGPIGTRWHPERHPLILADGLCKMTISGRTPGLIYITN